MKDKKKPSIDEDWEEEEEEEEDYEFDDDFEDEDDEVFKCRVCGTDFTYEDGDDYVLICDNCAENFNMDQIWTDFDTGKLKEKDLKSMDLEKYKYKD